jgi:hypothetical protein
MQIRQTRDVVYSKLENETFSSVFVKDYFTEKSGSAQRDPSSWFQGLSKDSYDIPSWRWTPSNLSPPPMRGQSRAAKLIVLVCVMCVYGLFVRSQHKR